MVYHKYCGVTNGIFTDPVVAARLGLTIHIAIDPNFEISQCEARCSNDLNCKGHVVGTQTYVLPESSAATSVDKCLLFTSTPDSSMCMAGPPIVTQSTTPIDNNADCPAANYSSGAPVDFVHPKVVGQKVVFLLSNLIGGCQIKSKY